jgi:hypothetical protein
MEVAQNFFVLNVPRKGDALNFSQNFVLWRVSNAKDKNSRAIPPFHFIVLH